MKITGIHVYQVDLPLHEGKYAWSEGKSVDVFDSTVVRIETDEGVVGHGEVCPLGPVYLPAYANGARAGISELAPQLLGEDPTELGGLIEEAWLRPNSSASFEIPPPIWARSLVA